MERIELALTIYIVWTVVALSILIFLGEGFNLYLFIVFLFLSVAICYICLFQIFKSSKQRCG